MIAQGSGLKVVSSAVTSRELLVEFDKALLNPNIIFGYGRYGDGKRWTRLDRLTGGLQELTLSVLLARPKVGKSMFASDLVPYIAMQALLEGKMVRIVSLEMSRKAYQRRMAAIMAGIKDPQTIRQGMVDKPEEKKYRAALRQLSLLPIEYLAVEKALTEEEAMIAGNSNITFDKVNRFIRQPDTYWWLLDHIGLLNDLNAFREISTSIYSLINKLAVLAHTSSAGMVITHLNRDAVGKSGGALSYISGSDQVGKAADQLLELRRPYFENGNLTDADRELIKEKEPCYMDFQSRDEGAGRLPLLWDQRRAYFDEAPLDDGVMLPMLTSKKKR